MDRFARLVTALNRLNRAGARFVLVGVAGANYYAPSAGAQLAKRDDDLFLPPKPENVLAAWQVCEAAGLLLSATPRALPAAFAETGGPEAPANMASHGEPVSPCAGAS